MSVWKSGLLTAALLSLAAPFPALAQPAQITLTAEQQSRLDALIAEAEAIDKIADPRAYREVYERALAFAETLYPPDHPELVILDGEIDFAYFMLGELEALPARLERAERIFAAAGPAYRQKYIETLNNLGVINDALGRGEEGLPYKRRAIALWLEDTPEGSPVIVTGMNNLAWGLRGLDRNSEALEVSQDALAMAERLFAEGDPGGDLIDAYLVGVNNQTIILAELDREAEAAAVVREGIVRGSALLGADHPRIATLLLNGSNLLVRTGQFAEAEAMARRALSIREAAYGPEAPTSAEARLNLLVALNARGRHAEVIPLAQYTLSVLEKAQGAQTPQALEARSSLAVAYFSTGREEEALDLFRSLIASYSAIREPGHEDIDWYQQRLAIALARLGRWEEALPVVTALLESGAGTKDELSKNWQLMLALRAVAEAKAGDRALAERYLAMAAPRVLETWRTEVENEGAQGRPDRFTDWALGWLAVAAGDLGMERESFTYAQYVGIGASERALLRARQRAAAQDPKVAAALRERQDVLEQRELQLTAFQAAASQGNSAAASEANAAISELDAQLTDMAALNAPLLAPEDAAALQSRISPDGALLFIIGSDLGTYVYALTRDGLVRARSPEPTARIDALVAALRGNLEAGLASGAPYDSGTASALYEAVFTPEIIAALSGKSDVSIIARGELAKLPFGLLVNEAGEYAIARHAFSYPLALGNVGRGRGSAQYASFLGIGAPSLPATGAPPAIFRGPENVARVSALGELGLAESELRAMALALNAQRSTILAGPLATEAGVRAADLSGADILTFATHGLMGGELEGLDEAALVLSPPFGEGVPELANDGLLTVSEIAQLDLGAALVVLSACNSASGNGLDGEAFGGLASAFLYAGADSLLASHWRVRDDAAARLTVRTAQGTASGLSQAEALRRAKLELMADAGVEGGTHPAIWAPFVFVGG